MTKIYVERESHTTDARLFVPTVQMRDDTQVIAGANQPLIVRQDTAQSVIDGIVFYVFKMAPANALLVAGGSIEFLITTAVNRPVGIGFVSQCGGNAEVYVYEDVTNVVGGTLTVPLNRNRASANTAVTGALLNPSSYTLGPLIYSDLILGGSGGNAAGATAQSDYSVLAANKSYLFRLTNTTNQDHTAELMVQWIENG
jgi:hypothetical protein